MTLCSLIIVSTLANYAHRVLDVIGDRNEMPIAPAIRVGNVQRIKTTAIDNRSNNMIEMPLMLSKNQEILDDKWSEAA